MQGELLQGITWIHGSMYSTLSLDPATRLLEKLVGLELGLDLGRTWFLLQLEPFENTEDQDPLDSPCIKDKLSLVRTPRPTQGPACLLVRS